MGGGLCLLTTESRSGGIQLVVSLSRVRSRRQWRASNLLEDETAARGKVAWGESRMLPASQAKETSCWHGRSRLDLGTVVLSVGRAVFDSSVYPNALL